MLGAEVRLTNRFHDMRGPLFTLVCIRDLLTPLRVVCFGVCLRPGLLGPWLVAIVRSESVRAGVRQPDAEGFAPLRDGLGRDAEPVADRLVRFALDGFRQVPVENHGLRRQAWSAP